MDLGENDELREALLGPEGDDDLEFYITFPTPTALVRKMISFFRLFLIVAFLTIIFSTQTALVRNLICF